MLPQTVPTNFSGFIRLLLQWDHFSKFFHSFDIEMVRPQIESRLSSPYSVPHGGLYKGEKTHWIPLSDEFFRNKIHSSLHQSSIIRINLASKIALLCISSQSTEFLWHQSSIFLSEKVLTILISTLSNLKKNFLTTYKRKILSDPEERPIGAWKT